ncbi:lysozyme inhibitor LprI family protein [Pseudomonas sp. LS1212]|uniref:lysozyme inhibitor LprI family protein n=1 Tax=Pseudomonas sp. LS1212 TaxID=2972478 RepID=UPI00215C9E8F|nr:lysozyme inhibitor LprI family protein [Pseudomonas sp. LS1212]UVJ42768.1 lysozyme inhibitor LprI family protein [Pseudomonas sp. LS1212]
MRFLFPCLALAALLPLAAHAADDCDATQMAMNQCASNDLAKADADLNKYYKEQMGFLQGKTRQQALKDSQRKWIAFRDADCLYQVGKAEDSGTIWPLIQAKCLAEHTRLRAQQLKNYTQCRSEDCPR